MLLRIFSALWPRCEHAWALAILLVSSALQGPPARGEENARPAIGAIRWDGWQVDGTVGHAVSKSLTPSPWRYRLPFYAKIREDGSPEMRGDTPEVMTAEIAAAKTARLDYWAFLAYDEADPMS